MNKNIIYTGWYKDFVCPGGDCGLTCCTDAWKIELHDAEIEKYEKLPTNLRKLVCDAIDYKNKQFRCENGKCCLLNEDGYCKLVLEGGEKYLSETCAFFPRVSQSFGDVELRHVEIACPLVARRLFEREAIYYVEEVEELASIPFLSSDKIEFRDNLSYVRNCMMEVLNYMPEKYVYGKLYIIYSIFGAVIKMIKNNNFTIENIDLILNAYSGIDNINEIFETSEEFGKLVFGKAEAICEVLLVLNKTSLINTILFLSIEKYPEIKECMVIWMNNRRILEEDIRFYSQYMEENYPMFTEKFLQYSLFANWLTLDKENFAEMFRNRIIEQLLIHLCALAVLKTRKEISLDDYSVLTALIDRKISHTNGKAVKMLFSKFFEDYDEELVMKAMLLFIR